MQTIEIIEPEPIDPCPIRPKRKPSKSIHSGGQLRLDDDVIKMWQGRRKELEFKLRLDALIKDDSTQLKEMAQDLRDLRTILKSTSWPVRNPEYFIKAVRVINRLLGTTNRNTKTR